jgi:hypothetical protein
MIAKHRRYEVTSLALAAPVAASNASAVNEHGGEQQAWAPDGSSFCTYSTAFVPAGLWLYDAATLTAQNLATRFPENSQLEGCWPTGAAVAIQFKPPGDLGYASTVAVVDATNTGDDGATSAVTLPDFWRVEAWLPDSSGFIVSKSNNCTPCNSDEQIAAAMTLDGAMHALPFEVATANTSERDYGFVLATVGP